MNLIVLCCLVGLSYGLNDTYVEDFNKKFNELFERMKILEDRNAKLEQDCINKDKEIIQLKRKDREFETILKHMTQENNVSHVGIEVSRSNTQSTGKACHTC